MQRRARLKAMFRHSSSEETMSLCRSFYKHQRHRVVTDGLHTDGCYTWPRVFFSVCACCSWLTAKYWMISGLLLDLSSTSVNTSNTSMARGEKKLGITQYETGWIHEASRQHEVCFRYPRLLLLLRSSSGTWSCPPRSARPRPICWRGEGNQWARHLVKIKKNTIIQKDARLCKTVFKV